jgi:hypothetical protein
MATSTEIKAQIDLEITDVTIAGGVSNVNEGERMKDILDYVDQQDADLDTSIRAYVDQQDAALQSQINNVSAPFEWNAQVFQSGTSNPGAQVPQIETLLVGGRFSTPSAFRDVEFQRTNVGTYKLRVRYTQNTVPTEVSKLSVIFGDAVCRVVSSTNGAEGGGTPYNYKEWVFETHTPSGTLSDGLLLGQNGSFINIKLYL